jgi:MFS family permease
MGLRQLFAPKPTISREDIDKGLRWITLEGVATMGFWSIITSGFLAAYALALGANNLQIGVLAALPFLTQPIQLAVIPLIERTRRRKVVAVVAALLAQAIWIPIALIPVFMDVPGASAISLLLILIGFRGVLVAIWSCAWNSLMRDLIPQKILGSYYARRLMLANLAGIFFALSAAFFVDHWRGGPSGEEGALVYTIPLLFGFLTLAMWTPLSMASTPEPLMQRPTGSQPSLWSTLSTPFRDRNYRHLLRFLFLWGMALNLAIPFFVVYMLQVLELSLAAVIALTTLSQAMNLLFLGLWGRFADRFGSKAILSLSASLYLLVILGWIFTAMPDRYFFTIPLLVILHMTAGIAAAGVTLTIGTIGMKLAPDGQGTSYLAVAAITTSLGAGIGPLLGGLFADFFSVREFGIDITWVDPTRSLDVSALHLTGFEFLFGVAFVLGLLSINLLTALREEGEAGREVVLDALNAPMRRLSRPMSSVPGLNFLTQC